MFYKIRFRKDNICAYVVGFIINYNPKCKEQELKITQVFFNEGIQLIDINYDIVI